RQVQRQRGLALPARELDRRRSLASRAGLVLEHLHDAERRGRVAAEKQEQRAIQASSSTVETTVVALGKVSVSQTGSVVDIAPAPGRANDDVALAVAVEIRSASRPELQTAVERALLGEFEASALHRFDEGDGLVVVAH